MACESPPQKVVILFVPFCHPVCNDTPIPGLWREKKKKKPYNPQHTANAESSVLKSFTRI